MFPFQQKTVMSGTMLKTLGIIINSKDEALQLTTSENYTLSVTDNEANITADTVYGALRGLETFTQFVSFNHTQRFYYVPYTPIKVWKKKHPI